MNNNFYKDLQAHDIDFETQKIFSEPIKKMLTGCNEDKFERMCAIIIKYLNKNINDGLFNQYNKLSTLKERQFLNISEGSKFKNDIKINNILTDYSFLDHIYFLTGKEGDLKNTTILHSEPYGIDTYDMLDMLEFSSNTNTNISINKFIKPIHFPNRTVPIEFTKIENQDQEAMSIEIAKYICENCPILEKKIIAFSVLNKL